MDFPTILRIARRRALVIIVCVIAVPAIALALSVSQQKEYSASAQLLFRDPGFDQKLFGSNAFQPPTDPTREAATNSTLVSLEAVAARTARQLGGGLTGDDIKKKVSVSPQGQADVIGVTATDHDPKQAA